MTINPELINSSEEVPDWDAWDERVKKIVLGDLDTIRDDEPSKGIRALRELPSDLATRFPRLTHLYVWNLPELSGLPKLPRPSEDFDGLVCLDVRGCDALESVPILPSGLRTLILDGAPLLREVVIDHSSDDSMALEELSVQAAEGLEPESVRQLLDQNHRLEIVDLSGCRRLDSIVDWPPAILDLRLNDCPGLRALPDHWPPGLRRLELRGSPLEEVDRLPNSIDYIDLGRMRRLRKLPENWERARTLFLHGSGCLIPPASEHGAAADENVADRTRRYLEDVSLVGPGSVKRCKVLVLGNGHAGKTCLSLSLVGGDPRRTRDDHEPKAERLGSTHGVQFHPWQVEGLLGNRNHKVSVHVWDFGGQEIYHNTHRLFLSSGTVFVVVWDPSPPRSGATDPAAGNEDTARPLGYWLDYIEQATAPATPEVLVVCSKRHERDEAALEQMRAEAGEERLDRLKVYFLDSLEQRGDVQGFQADVEQRILRVVTAQGTMVPAYWEIAQDMVEGWVSQQADGNVPADERRQITAEEFRAALDEELRRRSAAESKFKDLRTAIESESFALDEDRIERTLAFLTHSGWVFWDSSLLDQRVIVGQRWALECLYTLLERSVEGRPSPVYGALKRAKGVFTLEDLDRWGWGDTVPDPQERELLVSFMQRIGQCFRLVHRDESLWGTPVYVSLAHLPFREELSWAAWDAEAIHDLNVGMGEPSAKRIDLPGMHAGHWEALLRNLGQQFGTDGRYAKDGFIGSTRRGQRIRVEFQLDPSGFGGSISVDVAGPDADELRSEILGAIGGEVRAQQARRSPERTIVDVAGEAAGAVSVFISYAWNPREEPSGTTRVEVPKGYEVPVDAILHALRAARFPVQLRRDQDVIQPGDDILEFMRSIKTADRVIVVHSDKFWHSPYCMFELTELCRGLSYQTRDLFSVLTLVSHLQTDFSCDGYVSPGPLNDLAAGEQLIDHWETVSSRGFPPMLSKKPGLRGLKAAVLDLLENRLEELHALAELNLRWSEDKAAQEELVQKIIERVQAK